MWCGPLSLLAVDQGHLTIFAKHDVRGSDIAVRSSRRMKGDNGVRHAGDDPFGFVRQERALGETIAQRDAWNERHHLIGDAVTQSRFEHGHKTWDQLVLGVSRLW